MADQAFFVKLKDNYFAYRRRFLVTSINWRIKQCAKLATAQATEHWPQLNLRVKSLREDFKPLITQQTSLMGLILIHLLAYYSLGN